jgi:VWFA-related protein
MGSVVKKIPVLLLSALTTLGALIAQTQNKSPQSPPDDVLRITAELVQSDVVVTDKNDQPVPDLKLEDFELFENGHRQDLKFIEFVDAGARSSQRAPSETGITQTATRAPTEITIRNLRHVIAFVIDDVTVPREDISRVREMLIDFVDHKMLDDELVAIVRTAGGSGLLEQFTSDRETLHRAIGQIGASSVPPYLAFQGADRGRVIKPPSPGGSQDTSEQIGDLKIDSNLFADAPSEGANQTPRPFLALSLANQLIDSLQQVPGRKNLVLVSGGLPMFEVTTSGRIGGDIGQLFHDLTDNATRSGVVINTMDIRGLTTAAAKFENTPAQSALGGDTLTGDLESFKANDNALLGSESLTNQLTLSALAGNTGGVSVVHSNNFSGGLDKVLSRRAYYRLAYRPSEPFNDKFHRIEIKVRRPGVHVYTAQGYFARADKTPIATTKEAEIIKAATSPLARRDLDVAAELQYKFLPNNQAQLDIDTFIDAHKLQFSTSDNGKRRASFDVAGFVFDQLGRNRGGISQTVNVQLSDQEYETALANGLSYTASTQAPPGYYQVRIVVREGETGKIGSVARYFEVPDLSTRQLAMSSVMLYQIDLSHAGALPQQLPATRVISRRHDLRYAVVLYNARLDNNKLQAKSQLIISQDGQILLKEPERPIQTAGTVAGQFIQIGQLGLAKVNPGRYLLTIVVRDPLADKKRQVISRTVDFTVSN